MVKRNESLVAVRDPKGKLFEVGRRNATDLVQHKGWTYDRPAEPTTDELATAGRTRRARGEKVEAARKLAAEEKAAAATTSKAAQAERAKTEKKARGRPKTVKLPEYDVDAEDDDDVVPFDAAAEEADIEDEFDEELDALEREEEARIPKGIE